jgi:multicomponent Na+:H+ antiporter subunit D
MTPEHVAPLLVAGPLGMAALVAGAGSFVSRRLMDAAAFVTAVAVLAGAVWVASRTTAGAVDHWTAGWVLSGGSALGIRLLIEPLGAGLAALAALLVAATFAFSWRYFEEIGHMYHALVLVLLGGICGLSFAGDLFNLFVFLEILSVSAYALTAYKVEESGLVGAFNYALTNTIGGVLVLFGIGLIYMRTGVLDMTFAGRGLGAPDAAAVTALAVILVGFFVKAAIAPFHFWAPDTYAAAPTPVAVLFGGVMLEVGIFSAARVYWLIFAPSLGTPEALRALVLLGGTVTAVLASAMVLLQRDLKRLFAFSIIAHVAVLVIGFGLLGTRALAGTALLVPAHGALMGALFLCAGILRQKFHSADEIRLHGFGRPLTYCALVVFVAALALAAPPFSGMHAGEALIEEEARSLGLPWIPWLFVFVAACTSGAILRASGRIFLGWGPSSGMEATGPESRDSGDGGDEDTRGPAGGHPWGMLMPAAVLTVVGVWVPALAGVRGAALAAAAHLAGRPNPGLSPMHVSWPSIAGPAAALACAAVLLLRHRMPRFAAAFGRGLKPLVRLLQRAHTPHAGDHIGWLVLGAGIVVLVLNLTLAG